MRHSGNFSFKRVNLNSNCLGATKWLT
jgi:hypothetical protein